MDTLQKLSILQYIKVFILMLVKAKQPDVIAHTTRSCEYLKWKQSSIYNPNRLAVRKALYVLLSIIYWSFLSSKCSVCFIFTTKHYYYLRLTEYNTSLPEWQASWHFMISHVDQANLVSAIKQRMTNIF